MNRAQGQYKRWPIDEEERATVADLRLWLGEQNVCLHLRGLELVDHRTIPLYPLAEGLAHDWWRLFAGRDASMSLIAYRSGFACRISVWRSMALPSHSQPNNAFTPIWMCASGPARHA